MFTFRPLRHAAFAAWILVHHDAWAQPIPIGTVANVVGDARILRAGAKLPVSKGMAVFPSDTLMTTDKSAVKLQFSEGGTFLAFENAEATIEEYYTRASGRGAGLKSVINVAAGRVRFFVKPGQDGPVDATYKTSNAVMGIRGTSGFIDASTPGKTSLVVLSGQVQVANPQIPGNFVLVDQNHMSEIVGRSPPSVPKISPPALLLSLNGQAKTLDPALGDGGKRVEAAPPPGSGSKAAAPAKGAPGAVPQGGLPGVDAGSSDKAGQDGPRSPPPPGAQQPKDGPGQLPPPLGQGAPAADSQAPGSGIPPPPPPPAPGAGAPGTGAPVGAGGGLNPPAGGAGDTGALRKPRPSASAPPVGPPPAALYAPDGSAKVTAPPLPQGISGPANLGQPPPGALPPPPNAGDPSAAAAGQKALGQVQQNMGSVMGQTNAVASQKIAAPPPPSGAPLPPPSRVPPVSQPPPPGGVPPAAPPVKVRVIVNPPPK